MPPLRAYALVLLVGATLLSGCAPLLLGGAVIGTGLVVTDRRTTGMQLEDRAIENKGEARAKELATLGRITVTSYNRTVLITGEVPGESERAAVEKAVSGVENVRAVVNELVVAPTLTLSQRSGDSLLGAKVKASLVDAKDVAANAYRVLAERGVVYLMGARKALAKAGLTIDQIDLFEVNEAFAAVPMRFMKEMGVPHEKVNVNGGGTVGKC